MNATALIAAVGDAGALPALAISRPGWGSSRDQPRPAAGRGCSASPTRQQIPAQLTDPRCAGGAALARDDREPLGNWLRGLSARAHRNTVIVAVASNLARIAWAVLRSTVTYSAMIGVRPALGGPAATTALTRTVHARIIAAEPTVRLGESSERAWLSTAVLTRTRRSRLRGVALSSREVVASPARTNLPRRILSGV